MLRQELADLLAIMSPALAKNDSLPKPSHFWFSGDRAYAYNTVIAMQAPLKVALKGGIPGSRMLSLLQASRFKECEFDTKHADELIIKGKGTSTRLSFAMLPFSELGKYGKVRTINKQRSFAVNREAFDQAVRVVLISVAKDGKQVGTDGITFIGRGKTVDMFSTNDAQLSHCTLKITEGSWTGKALVPPEFLRQALALMIESDKNIWLDISDDPKDSVIQTAGKRDVLLTGSLLDAKPRNFDKIVGIFFPAGSEKLLMPIPTKLELVMERAAIVEADSADEITTEIEVKGNRATFKTESKKGDAFDEVAVEKGRDAKLKVSPRRIREGIGIFSNMLITDKAFIMDGKGIRYFVVGRGE